MHRTLDDIRELRAQGKLTPVQQLILAKIKPKVELCDLHADPQEVNNLAESIQHQAILEELRTLLDGWIAVTGDEGLAQIAAPKGTEQ